MNKVLNIEDIRPENKIGYWKLLLEFNRLNSRINSNFSASKVVSHIDSLPIRIISAFMVRIWQQRRHNSRHFFLMRFLFTAGRIRRCTVKPIFVVKDEGLATRIKLWLLKKMPLERMSRNSWLFFIMFLLGKVNLLFNPLFIANRQTFTTFSTTSLEDLTTAFGAHASAESMFIDALTIARLKSTFHDFPLDNWFTSCIKTK